MRVLENLEPKNVFYFLKKLVAFLMDLIMKKR